jgi:hypothetical protein
LLVLLVRISSSPFDISGWSCVLSGGARVPALFLRDLSPNTHTLSLFQSLWVREDRVFFLTPSTYEFVFSFCIPCPVTINVVAVSHCKVFHPLCSFEASLLTAAVIEALSRDACSRHDTPFAWGSLTSDTLIDCVQLVRNTSPSLGMECVSLLALTQLLGSSYPPLWCCWSRGVTYHSTSPPTVFIQLCGESSLSLSLSLL